MRALKARTQRDIALYAGAKTRASFLREGLVDELRLIVNPQLLGVGTLLFQEGIPRRPLTLTQTRVFRSGVTMLTYRIDKS